MTKLEQKNIGRNEKYVRRLMFGLKVGSEGETKCYVCKFLFSLKAKSYAKGGRVYADAECSECGYSVEGLWVKNLDIGSSGTKHEEESK